MALVLLLVFRSRLRLLPLALALAAAALTFGLLGLVGGSLTMASIAVAADPDRPRRRLRDPVPGALRRGGRRRSSGAEAASAAARAAARRSATACLATAAGFLALQLSPTPMVRGFGLLLDRRHRDRLRLGADRRLRGAEPRGGRGPRRAGRADPAVPSARAQAPPRRRSPAGAALSLRSDASASGCWASALALAVVGWGVGTQIETRVRHPRSWRRRTSQAVRDLNELQDATGVSGELDVSVEAPDLTDPATIEWMAGFKQRVLREQRLPGADPSCLDGRNLPGAGALGLPRQRRRHS